MGRCDCSAKTLQYFREGYNCAQSVLLAHDHITGLPHAKAARIMSGFGGGVGKTGGLCGAVTAAVALLGMLHGREQADQMDRQAETYEYVRQAMEAFAGQFGSVECRSLLGGDILAPGVKELARDAICPEFLPFSCQLIALYRESAKEGEHK